MEKKKSGIFWGMLLLILCSCIVFWNEFMRGSDFSWTVKQEKYWDAVLEMLLFFWGYFIVLSSSSVKRFQKFLGVILIFLLNAYLHAFFWAVIVGCGYVAFIFITGYSVRTFIQKRKKNLLEDIHVTLVVGMATIIILVAVASALKIGTPGKLRILFYTLFCVEIAVMRKILLEKIREVFSKVAHNGNSEVKNDYLKTFFMAVTFTMVTLQVAQANMGTDYDSLWYGLKSQYVLAPDTGIFDSVTMMACVYTYSKGFEVLTLVFAGLDTYSFIISMNVMFSILALVAVYQLGRITTSEKSSWVMVMLVSLTPAIMNMAISAKSDTITLYLQIVALIYGIRMLKEREGKFFGSFLAISIFTLGFKPTSIIFTSMIVGAVLIMLFVNKVHIRRNDVWIFTLTSVSVGTLWLRTFVITGYPITSLLTGVFESLGYYPKYPYTLPTARTLSISELLFSEALWIRIKRLVQLFFYPNVSELVTLERTWWGILFTIIWICTIILIGVKIRKVFEKCKCDTSYLCQVILFVICSAMSIGCMLLLETPDGNYFMLMYVLTYWYALTEVKNVSIEEKKIYIYLGIPLIISNFLLSVAISPAWIVGVTPIELDNYGYYNHKEKYVKQVMENNALLDVYEYLEEGKMEQIIAYTDKEDAVLVLPCRVEAYSHQICWGPDTLESADALYQYLLFAEVDGILVDESYASNYKENIELLQQLAEHGVLMTELSSNGYTIFCIKEKTQYVDESAVEYFNEIIGQQ